MFDILNHLYTRLQITSRQATLDSKKRINDLEKRNREELFGRTIKHDASFVEQFELKQRGIQRRYFVMNRKIAHMTQSIL